MEKINKERVYFPGYIMIQASLAGEIPHIIRSINGVIGFLGETKGGDPVPLRQSEVNRMLGKVDELAVQDDNINIPYIIGETVKVIDGPFNGFNGTVEKINEEKTQAGGYGENFRKKNTFGTQLHASRESISVTLYK